MRKSSLLVVVALAAVGCVTSALMMGLTAPPHVRATNADGPRRIVTMAPSLTETVFALGCGERVVGVSDWTIYPPEATSLPSAGSAFSPNLERLVELDPDLVIVFGARPKLKALCRERSIPMLELEVETLDDLGAALGAIGAALGVPDRATELWRTIRGELDDVARRVEGRERPGVFLCTMRDDESLGGLGTMNRASFLTELIEIAGGRNVFADAPVRYAKVSVEALVERAPDVVIELRGGSNLSAEERADLVAGWGELSVLPAVRDGRVHVLTESHVLILGPRIGATARRLAAVIHPEARP